MNSIARRNSILSFAFLLIIINTVLKYSVTAPISVDQPTRYVIYWELLLISSMGVNLLVLAMGFFSDTFQNPVSKLNKIYLNFLFIGLIAVIICAIIFKKFSSSDIWILFFPVSHNDFELASSLLIFFVFGNYIRKIIEKFSSREQNAIIFILFWFVLIMPFIFGKQLWGITSAYSFVWIGTLYFIGTLFSQIDLKLLKMRRVYLIIGGFTLLIIPFLLKIMNFSADPTAVNSRLFAAYSLPLFVVSVCLFEYLLNLKILSKFELNWLKGICWVIANCYFIVEMPIVKNHLNNEWHINYNLRSGEWLENIFLQVGILVILSILMTVCLRKLYSMRAFYNTFLKSTTIQENKQLMNIHIFVKRLINENWRTILVLIIGFCSTFVGIMVTYCSIGAFNWNLIRVILQGSSQQLLLNVVIFYLFFILLMGVINRYWYSLILTFSIYVLITVSEYFKISLREEPILPSDLSMITSIGHLVQMVNPIILVLAIILITTLCLSSVVLQKKFDEVYHLSIRRRIVRIVVPMAFFLGCFFVNHTNSPSQIILNSFGVQKLFYDQNGGARLNGPIVQFINNLDITVMDKPKGYSEKNIDQIMHQYDKTAKQINKYRDNKLSDQTIIFNLSESFSDPNRVPNLKVTPNPIPFLTKLKTHTDSGLMLSSGYGGGTANMEWQSLTGLSISNLSPTLPTPYTQLVPDQKIAPAFTNLFDSSIAIHPYNASLYNRINVFKKFGFDKFYYQGSKYKLKYQKTIDKNPYVSDASAYKDTLRLISRKNTGSQFIQLSTMQNHVPFNNYYSKNNYTVTGSAISAGQKSSVKTYVKGLNYTDKSLKQFIQSINKIKRPVTVVWYGDHLAALYDKDSMRKYGIQLHETDYFIYNNKNKKLINSRKIFSPYSFSAWALKAGNIKVTPYYALITRVSENLPAMTIDPTGTQVNDVNGANIFVSQSGKKLKYSSLSKNQRKLLSDYKMIQYDLTAGKQYSAKWAIQKIK